MPKMEQLFAAHAIEQHMMKTIVTIGAPYAIMTFVRIVKKTRGIIILVCELIITQKKLA